MCYCRQRKRKEFRKNKTAASARIPRCAGSVAAFLNVDEVIANHRDRLKKEPDFRFFGENTPEWAVQLEVGTELIILQVRNEHVNPPKPRFRKYFGDSDENSREKAEYPLAFCAIFQYNDNNYAS